MFLTQSELGTALTRNATIAFSEGMKLAPTGGRNLFNVEMVTDLITENDTHSYDTFAQPTAEGGDYYISNPVKGFKIIHRQGKFTNSFETTKEMRKYDKYSVVGALGGIQGLGTSCGKTIEKYVQLSIGMGAGAGYQDDAGNPVSTIGSDGANNFSTSKTTKAGVGYSNLQAIAFGLAGLEAHENLFRKFPNHSGQQINALPDTIYHTRDPATKNLIEEYLNSRGNVGSPNMGVNVYGYKGPRYQTIELEYLDANPDGSINTSKKAYWGLARAKSPELQLKISQNPIVYEPQLVLRNRNLVIQTDCHFSHGHCDGTGATLSNV